MFKRQCSMCNFLMWKICSHDICSDDSGDDNIWDYKLDGDDEEEKEQSARNRFKG